MLGGAKTVRIDIIDFYDPSVVGRAAQRGTFFRYIPLPVGTPQLFVKADDGFSTNWVPFDQNGPGANDWLTTGNTGAGKVLGTLTADQWQFIVDAQERGGFFSDGSFYLKTHSGFPGSEYVTRTSGLVTNNAAFNTIETVPIVPNLNGTISVIVQGRSADSSKRANFKRDIAAYNNGSVSIDMYQTSFTSKSQASLDVQAVTGVDVIDIQVKGDSTDTMYWTSIITYSFVGES